MVREAVLVWRFSEAPLVLQGLSENGGDEDWIAEIPPHMSGEYIGWMNEGSAFGRCSVDEYEHPYFEGWTVCIGCHS